MIALVLAAAAGWLWVDPGPRNRFEQLFESPRRFRRTISPLSLAVVAAPCAGWVVFGGLGLVLGAAGIPLMWRVVKKIQEDKSKDHQSEHLALAADLIAACLSAGRSVEGSLALVGRVCPGELGSELSRLSLRLSRVSDPAGVWRAAHHGPLRPLARAFLRSQDSGVAISDHIRAVAREVRKDRRGEVRRDAREIGSRMALPLGVCFLPAFLLVGVVPVIIHMASGMIR